jgi:hypothetical protein
MRFAKDLTDSESAETKIKSFLKVSQMILLSAQLILVYWTSR